MGYVVTERVGRTVVAVDGVHDYSLEDPRGDPSAPLLPDVRECVASIATSRTLPLRVTSSRKFSGPG